MKLCAALGKVAVWHVSFFWCSSTYSVPNLIFPFCFSSSFPLSAFLLFFLILLLLPIFFFQTSSSNVPSSSPSVRDLGVLVDFELTMEGHISKLCQSCFFQLHQLRPIRHSFSRHALLTHVHAFISSRLDFCNSVLYGVSAYLLDRLQSILNAAARLVLKVSRYDHCISGAIGNELHWLPTAQRINFKICLLVRNCLAGTAWSSVYLSELCNLVSSETGRCHLRSAARSDLAEPRYYLERYSRRSFSVAGPHLWNLLPPDVRNHKIQKETKHVFHETVAEMYSACDVSKHQRRSTQLIFDTTTTTMCSRKTTLLSSFLTSTLSSVIFTVILFPINSPSHLIFLPLVSPFFPSYFHFFHYFCSPLPPSPLHFLFFVFFLHSFPSLSPSFSNCSFLYFSLPHL